MADLRCEHICASCDGRTVLSGVDLLAADGGLTAVLGAAGSGKTMLLRVIAGLAHPQYGRVSVGKRVVALAGVTHVSPQDRCVGYVPQSLDLSAHRSVADHIAAGLPRRDRRSSARIFEALELVGLSDECARRRPRELTAGERRRVALARALVGRPQAVLLDEPLATLDATQREQTLEAILQSLASSGATVVLATQDETLALSVAQQVAILRSGRIVQAGAPRSVYRAPRDLEVARLLGGAVVLPGCARHGRVRCVLGDLELLDREMNGAVQALIRPEQVEIHRPRERVAGAARNEAGARASALEADTNAVVIATAFAGASTVITLKLAGVTGRVSARMLGLEIPEPGERVHVSVRGAVTAFPAAITAPRPFPRPITTRAHSGADRDASQLSSAQAAD